MAKEEARGGVFYEEIMNGMESFSKNFGTNIDKISGMKELIVWEGITAYNKYNPNLSKDGKSFKNIKSSKVFLDPNLILAHSAMVKHKY